PREPLGYANLGLTYLRAGRFGEAESQLERARRLDTANVDVVLTLTKLYSLTNRSAEAHQLLTPFATDPRALYALAELERESGDSGQHRYAMRLGQVQGRAPANLAVRLQLADVWLTLGQADSTLRYLEAFRQLRPEPPRRSRWATATAKTFCSSRRLKSGSTRCARVSSPTRELAWPCLCRSVPSARRSPTTTTTAGSTCS